MAASFLAGCAALRPDHGPRRTTGSEDAQAAASTASVAARAPDTPSQGRGGAAQVAFVDRLAVASRDELASLGEGLRARVVNGAQPVDSLRYALWMATPGHAGFDADAAQRRLEALLAEGGLDAEGRALARIQLRYLKARIELLETNARLTQENRRLREQIKALTNLEREMGKEKGTGTE